MVDQDKVREAIRLLLEGIGEDPTREGLVETPDRVARMYTELAGGMDANASEHLSKTFAVSDNGLVIERDIPFYSLCEHHMLPFYGHATIGYIPNGRVAGSPSSREPSRCMRVGSNCRSSLPPRLPMHSWMSSGARAPLCSWRPSTCA